MGTEPAFFGQIDGDTRVSREEVEKMSKLVAAQKPDIVITHWPIDTHMDHQVASVLAIRAFVGMGEKPQIYYFEVNTGSQSQGFLPNTYVDISGSLEKKKAALFAHKSQGGEEIWREHHQIMAAWRGREIGVTAAEGFVRLNHGSGSALEGH
jgi:LmbE family N-acetylglucosaminyl deacetylase